LQDKKERHGKIMNEFKKLLDKHGASAMVYLPEFGSTTLVQNDAHKFALMRQARLEEKVLEKIESLFINKLKVNGINNNSDLDYMG